MLKPTAHADGAAEKSAQRVRPPRWLARTVMTAVETAEKGLGICENKDN